MSFEMHAVVIEEGLALLRRGDAMLAHEHFEDVFRVSEGEARVLFHALAQLSAGHVQLGLGRAQAAARTWEKANVKLQALGLDVKSLRDAQGAFLSALQLSREGPRLIEPSVLPPRDTWPVPALALLTTRAPR